jgi:hypothetical protein
LIDGLRFPGKVDSTFSGTNRMHLRKLFVVAAVSLFLAGAAMAQSDAATPSQPDASAPAPAKPAKKKKKSKSSKKNGKKTSRNRKKKSSAPSAAVQPEPLVPDDGEPPQLMHQQVAAGTRGRPLTVAAHATDANGVFGPILYVRKRGLGSGDYIPIRMIASKIVPGDYSADVPASLTNVDGLEYYIETWDLAGNGPARTGSAEVPMAVAIEEEKRVIATPTLPTNVTIKPRGAPPAITHAALTQALKGKPAEINARLVGDTGVQGAVVMFRHAGDKDYKALPMGNIGGDDYTATIPAAMTTSDLEYYVEAFDQYGNGPARSGAPNVPYALRVMDSAPAAVPAPAPAAVAARRRMLEDEDTDRTYIGLGIDGGAPGGGGVTLLVRPLWWLRLNGGLAYNVAGFGYRGGITLAPGDWAVTPTLNIDAGRYLSGDYTRFATVTDPNIRAALSRTTYTFATAQLGLEFGSQRRFSFYIRGGITYLFTTASAADVTAIAQGNNGDPNNTFNTTAETKFSTLAPCASLGFNLFVY